MYAYFINSLLHVLGFTLSQPTDDQRLVFDAYAKINVIFNKKPNVNPSLRYQTYYSRGCITDSIDLVEIKDQHYRYEAYVKTMRIEPAAVLFGGYWTPKKRMVFAMAPHDSITIRISLDENDSILSYQFEGQQQDICEYYQKKSVEVGYFDPIFQKGGCEEDQCDSLIKMEEQFVLANASKYQLPKWLIEEELAHAKLFYLEKFYDVPKQDYQAMRLNEYFCLSTVYKLTRDLNPEINTVCPIPGTWSLERNLANFEYLLNKISEKKGAENELTLWLLYNQILPKIKSKTDFKLFGKLIKKYLKYEPYRKFLSKNLETKKQNLSYGIINSMNTQDLIKENESYFLYLKDKSASIHPVIQSKIDELDTYVKIFILEIEKNEVYLSNQKIHQLTEREKAEFCCNATFMAFNAKEHVALLPSQNMDNALHLLAEKKW